VGSVDTTPKRWEKAVNSDGRYGRWEYDMARKLEEVRKIIETIVDTKT
jgi:hypothetical protein